jgi:hypothetical protein
LFVHLSLFALEIAVQGGPGERSFKDGVGVSTFSLIYIPFNDYLSSAVAVKKKQNQNTKIHPFTYICLLTSVLSGTGASMSWKA